MPTKITKSDLENLLHEVNELKLGPDTSEDYYRVGAYSLDYAYGGVKLVIIRDKGGISNVSPNGYGPKRDIYLFLKGMIAAYKTN